MRCIQWFGCVAVAFALLSGCGESREEKAERINAEMKAEMQKIMPGAAKMVGQIQKQIDWKKRHGISTERGSELCQRWLEAHPDKDVQDFWKYAVTVTPDDLETMLPESRQP
ncbi:MAG: hypothetical protein IPL86_19195 [Flavobacteriales bacterium]|nr:hypothetical protein [Flavobacteriales bacterium]